MEAVLMIDVLLEHVQTSQTTLVPLNVEPMKILFVYRARFLILNASLKMFFVEIVKDTKFRVSALLHLLVYRFLQIPRFSTALIANHSVWLVIIVLALTALQTMMIYSQDRESASLLVDNKFVAASRSSDWLSLQCHLS